MSDPIAPSRTGDQPTNLPASVEFRPRGEIHVDPAEWAAGAAVVRTGLTTEGLLASGMVEALNAFRFLDAASATWTYNGSDWSTWNGTAWVTAAPPTTLTLQPFSMDLVPDAPSSVPDFAAAGPVVEAAPVVEAPPEVQATPVVEAAPVPAPVVEAAPVPAPVVEAAPVVQPVPIPAPVVEAVPVVQPTPVPAPVVQPAPVPVPMPAPAPQAAPTPPAYWPSHVAPHTGLPAWSQPDPRMNPVTSLAPGLDVMVVEWLPTGWAHIVCSNQWSGWVDGRQLVPLNQQQMGYRR